MKSVNGFIFFNGPSTKRQVWKLGQNVWWTDSLVSGPFRAGQGLQTRFPSGLRSYVTLKLGAHTAASSSPLLHKLSEMGVLPFGLPQSSAGGRRLSSYLSCSSATFPDFLRSSVQAFLGSDKPTLMKEEFEITSYILLHVVPLLFDVFVSAVIIPQGAVKLGFYIVTNIASVHESSDSSSEFHNENGA